MAKKMTKFSKTVDSVKMSVVNIETETSLGAGVIIDDRGIILTNHHVIANSVLCTVKFFDGKEIQGKIIYSEPSVDIAFVYIKSRKKLNALRLEKRGKYSVGDTVIAYGNPLGLENTVTKGIVSNLGREIGDYKYIQTDVAINPGNSGGPLLDTDGNVIGINTLKIEDASGIGFAIPISSIAIIIDDVLKRFDRFTGGAYCKVCGTSNSIRRKYCKKCGSMLEKPDEPKKGKKNALECPVCGFINKKGDRYCANCGNDLKKKGE